MESAQLNENGLKQKKDFKKKKFRKPSLQTFSDDEIRQVQTKQRENQDNQIKQDNLKRTKKVTFNTQVQIDTEDNATTQELNDQTKKKIKLNSEQQQNLQQKKQEQQQQELLDLEQQASQQIHNNLFQRKGWNSKSSKSGKFNEQEVKTLMHAICRYIQEKNSGLEGLNKLILSRRNTDFTGAWSKISESLPERSVQSCHNYAKRHFNPNNYQGQWNQEEELRLIDSVHQHGRKWEALALEFGRTAGNVRDKYKELGEENAYLRVKNSWSVKELIKLIKHVQAQFEDLIFWDTAKTKEVIDLQPSRKQFLRQKFIQLIEKKYRDQKNNIMNLITSFVDCNKIQETLNAQINWNVISKKIKTKSFDDCRNFWYYRMLPYSAMNINYSENEDLILLNQIKQQDVEKEDEINFKAIKNGKNAIENKQRWKSLKKQVVGRNDSELNQILKELLEMLDNFKRVKELTGIENLFNDENQNEPQLKSNNWNNSEALMSLFKLQYSD